MNGYPIMLPLAALHPHPGNPCLAPRADVVEQIAVTLNGGMEVRHALTVRRKVDGYQILSGHHRHVAAKKAGLTEVPCWVVEMDEAAAYLELVRANAQSELTALERGFHALRSPQDPTTKHGRLRPAKLARAIRAEQLASGR